MEPPIAPESPALFLELFILVMKVLEQRAWRATLSRLSRTCRNLYFLEVPILYRTIDMKNSDRFNDAAVHFAGDFLDAHKFKHVETLSFNTNVDVERARLIFEPCLPYVRDLMCYATAHHAQMVWKALSRAVTLETLRIRLPSVVGSPYQQVSLPIDLRYVTASLSSNEDDMKNVVESLASCRGVRGCYVTHMTGEAIATSNNHPSLAQAIKSFTTTVSCALDCVRSAPQYVDG